MPQSPPSPEYTGDSSADRAALRRQALAIRLAIGEAEHAAHSRAVTVSLTALLNEWASARSSARKSPAVLAIWMPMRNEFDPRPLAATLATRGWQIAAPVVIDRKAAMIYRHWHSASAMTTDAYGLPAPAEGVRVQPDVVLAPLLAFDAAGFRLGYGGGCFDRTLAGFAEPPLTVGVGFESGRVATIFPQAHDIRLAVIVTEAGVVYHDDHWRTAAKAEASPAIAAVPQSVPSV